MLQQMKRFIVVFLLVLIPVSSKAQQQQDAQFIMVVPEDEVDAGDLCPLDDDGDLNFGFPLTADVWGFNSFIRTDLQPLTQEQIDRSLSLFVNKGDKDSDLLSELTLSNQSSFLRQSKCFYTEPAERPSLSWEVAISNVRELATGSQLFTLDSQDIGFCGTAPYFLNDRENRYTVEISGQSVLYSPSYFFDDAGTHFSTTPNTIALKICNSGGPNSINSHDSCGEPLDRGCVYRDIKTLCSVEIHGICGDEFPYPEDQVSFNEIDCFKGCLMPESVSLNPYYRSDASYSLQVASSADLTNPAPYGLVSETPANPLEPNLKVVNYTRTLSRPLTYQGDFTAPSGQTLTKWSWTVSEVQGKSGIVWEDNFSPNLSVTRVRFFKEVNNDGQIVKSYLIPDHFVLDGRPCVATEGNDVILDICGLAYTPTYQLGNPQNFSRNAIWEAGFQKGKSPLPGSNTPLFIEFEVAETRLRDQVLNLDVVARPSRLNFGSLPLNISDSQNFNVINDSSHNATITSITVREPFRFGYDSALDYTLNYPVSLPHTLGAGQQVPFTLNVNPANLETGMVDVVIEFRVGSATRTLKVRANLQVVDPSLGPASASILTPSLDFRNSPGSGIPAAVVGAPDRSFRRKAVIANSGYQDLELTNVRIEGANASAFQILEIQTSGTLDSNNVQAIHPGGYVDFVILYDRAVATAGSGPHLAILKMETNDPSRPTIEILPIGDYR